MLLTTVLSQRLAQGAEEHALPAEPWVFGLSAFVLLVGMLVVLLVFGKGRPHS